MIYKHWLLVLFCMMLCACGGNRDGGKPNTPEVDNTPPMLIVENAYRVPENISGALLTLASSDADGDVITYSITAQYDGKLFTLASETSQVSFAFSPDYESPRDLDKDNVYMLQIAASDGVNSPVYRDIMISVTDVSQVEARVLSPMPGSSLRMVGKKVRFRGLIVDVEDGVIDRGDFTEARFNGEKLEVVDGHWQAKADLPEFANRVSLEVVSVNGTSKQEYSYNNGAVIASPNDFHYDKTKNRLLTWDHTQKILFSHDVDSGERSIVFDAYEKIAANVTGNKPVLGRLRALASIISSDFALAPDDSYALFATTSQVLKVDLETGSYSVIDLFPENGSAVAISYNPYLKKFIVLYSFKDIYTVDEQGKMELLYTIDFSFLSNYGVFSTNKIQFDQDAQSIYFLVYDKCKDLINTCTIGEPNIVKLDLVNKKLDIVFSLDMLSDQFEVDSSKLTSFRVNENKLYSLANSNGGSVLLEYGLSDGKERIVKNLKDTIGKDPKQGTSWWTFGKTQDDIFFYNSQAGGVYQINIPTPSYDLISKENPSNEGLLGSHTIVDLTNKRFIVPSENGLWEVLQDGASRSLLVDGLDASVDDMVFDFLGKFYSPERNSLIGIASTPFFSRNSLNNTHRLVEYDLEGKEPVVLFGGDDVDQKITAINPDNYFSYDKTKNNFYFYGLLGKEQNPTIPYAGMEFIGVNLSSKIQVDDPSKVFFSNAGLDQDSIDLINKELLLKTPSTQKFDFENNRILAAKRDFGVNGEGKTVTIEMLSLDSFSRQALSEISLEPPTFLNLWNSSLVDEKLFFFDYTLGYSLHALNLVSGEYELLYGENYSGSYTIGFPRNLTYDSDLNILYFQDSIYGGLFSYDLELKQLSLMFR